MKKEKKKPTTVLLNESTPMTLEKMARNEGLNRTTGIPSGETVGSISQLLIHIARNDVVIVKRHKTSEELPPDGVLVLAYGDFYVRGDGNEYKFVKYSYSPSAWYVDAGEYGLRSPLYWFNLRNLLEGVE